GSHGGQAGHDGTSTHGNSSWTAPSGGDDGAGDVCGRRPGASGEPRTRGTLWSDQSWAYNCDGARTTMTGRPPVAAPRAGPAVIEGHGESREGRPGRPAREGVGTTAPGRSDAPMAPRTLILKLFEMNGVGHLTHGLWRLPDNNRHRYTDLDYWTELARIAGDAGFTTIFLADVVGAYDVYGGSAET